MATLPSLSPPPPSPLSKSPYSLSKQNDGHTDSLGMTVDLNELQRMTTEGQDEMELTTSGRTYQELIEQAGRASGEMMSDESDSNEEDNRKSLCFLSGRNSISQWSTFGDELGKERASYLSTPQFPLDASNVNGKRGSRSVKRATDSHPQFVKRRSSPNNLSHISSSSSSSGEMGASWSPILSLETSFEKRDLRGRSKSPMKSLKSTKSPTRSPQDSSDRSKSPMKSLKSRKSPLRDRSKSPMRSSLVKSPTRSPLGDISPNRSRGQSPKKSLLKSSAKSPVKSAIKEATALSPVKSPLNSSLKQSTALSPVKSPSKPSIKQALSPNGTYSLKEAEGSRLDDADTTQSPEIASNATLAPDAELFSPERPATGISRERSPAPTPNSQRRVMKRFRASLPVANYLMPEDVLEESMEMKDAEEMNVATEKSMTNPDSSEVATRDSMQGGLEENTTPAAIYENEFEYPSISRPCTKTLAFFHSKAIAQGPVSHQYQLSTVDPNLLSIQEVILPSVAHDTKTVLKQLQAKAQRNVQDGKPDAQGKDVVDVIETCRKVVAKCTTHAVEVAGKSWRERQEQRHQSQLKHHASELEKQKQLRAQAKKERKEQRALARQQHYERQRYEKQKSHPRNKEMWQEVAKLMMDIQKLEKEERMWKGALSEVDSMEKNFQPPEKLDLELLDDAQNPRAELQTRLCDTVAESQLETESTTILQDITIATERISWMLQSVSLAMEESDRLRREAFNKYQHEGHKFYGYQTGDAKGLFVLLSMDDSFA